MFPWSLKGEAKDWLESLSEGGITTWTQMVDKFLTRFFPASRTVNLQAEITQFRQKPNETLYDAWTRFEKLFRMCPQHGFDAFQKVSIFYRGATISTRKEIDTAAGGQLIKKTPDEAYKLISETASHSHEWHDDQFLSRNVNAIGSGFDARDEMAAMNANIANLGRQIEKVTKDIHAIKIGCELCGGSHSTRDCTQKSTMERMEDVNYVNNHQNFQAPYQQPYPRNNSQQYYPSNNFAQRNNPPGIYPVRNPIPPYQPQNLQNNQSSSLESTLAAFIKSQSETNEALKSQILQFQNNHNSSIQKLESNVTKLFERVKASSSSEKKVQFAETNTLTAKTITTSDPDRERILANCPFPNRFEGEELEYHENPICTGYSFQPSENNLHFKNDVLIFEQNADSPKEEDLDFPTIEDLMENPDGKLCSEKEELKKRPFIINKIETINLPTSSSINKDQINIAIDEVKRNLIAALPKLGITIKDILDYEESIIPNPPKRKNELMRSKDDFPPILPDPGLFLIPCRIRGPEIMALADLGASINTMSLSIYKRCQLGPLEKTDVAIRLVDESIHKPVGAVKAVATNIGDLSFLVDYLVLDIPDDGVHPIILGRPFLSTAKATIDMRFNLLTLREGDLTKTISITPRDHYDSEEAHFIHKASNKCGGGNRPEKGIVLEGADGGHVFEVD